MSDAREHDGGRQASQAASALGVSRRDSNHAKSLWGSAIVVHLFFVVQAFADSGDVLVKRFLEPPARYGVVPFYWWTGEPLSLKRITWQLDQLKANGFSGVNVNYTHTSLGHSYKGEPPLFSEAWWKLWGDVVDACAERKMAIGFDDYLVTHGNPQLATVGSQIRRDHPEVAGLLLRERSRRLEKGQRYVLEGIARNRLVASNAYRVVGGKPDSESRIDLRPLAGRNEWIAPEGSWLVSAVYTEPQPFGAMNPLYAQKVIEHYFAEFERHSRGQIGKAVNFFFQDELTFGGSMPYWSANLPEAFRRQKGYDLLPEVSALFHDIGPRTPKVRLDYYDVATGLMEEAYFRPIFDWCEERNVIYGHDQCSRADVVSGVQLYGDYFRTLRWYQAPGTDRIPDLTRGKVSASIAQLYDRPRVWLEAYHSTGWGVTPEDIRRWDCEALLYGYNLFSYHSLYYTTRAGWWAWAPGDLHFRQPYWSWMKRHYDGLRRLCFLLSQGKHRCDVAVLFPTSAVQADMTGTRPGSAAARCRELMNVTVSLFKEHGIDFAYVDDDAIARASVSDGALTVAGGAYRVLILPAVTAIRRKTLDKTLEFYRNGGVVVALAALPEASDRAGADDPVLDAAITEIFGLTADKTGLRKNAAGGIGCLLAGSETRVYPGGFAGRWLWSKAPSRDVYFKTVWRKGWGSSSARRKYDVRIFADNQFVMFVNGRKLADSRDWQVGWTGKIDLAAGDVITIDARDHDRGGDKAGLFVAIAKDGKTLLSSEDFRCTATRPTDLKAWRMDWSLSGLGKLDISNVHPNHLGQEDSRSLAARLARLIDESIDRDVVCRGGRAYVMHRSVGKRDVYALYNPRPERSRLKAFFRIVGKHPEQWDAWAATVQPVRSYRSSDHGTEIELSLDPFELKTIVLTPEAGASSVAEDRKADSLRETIALDGPWEFTVAPVLDNRWGDFRSPPSDEFIGPEARQFRYATQRGEASDVQWQAPDHDDASWPVTTSSWGPRFWLLGPVPNDADAGSIERAIAAQKRVDPERPVRLGDVTLHWRPYEFSLRWGRQNDPLLCGQTGIAIHGPIGWVPDEFIHLDTPFEGAAWYLWTSLESPRRQETRLAVGTRAGCEAWLNGRSILTRQDAKPEVRGGNWNFRHYPSATHSAPIVLEHGGTPFLLKLRGAGARTMVRAFVALGDDLQDAPERPLLEMPSGDASYVPSGLVASRWYARPRPARFDLYAQQPPRAMWYRFAAPPGLEAMRIVAHGQPRVWVGGRELSVRVVGDADSPAKTHEGASVYRASADRPFSVKTTAAIRLVPRVGFYAGAAMPEPVRFECGTGQAPLGDWSGLGLSNYSGAVRYAKAVALPDKHVAKQVLLSLGDVAAAARILVNGQEAGTCLGRPWQIDISRFVRAGGNRIEIVVANTLASHYSVGMPCGKRYVRPGQTRAGLFGPVTIQIRSKPSL